MTSFWKKNNWKYFSRHQVALESWNYDHSTSTRKIHQAVVTVYFRKRSSLTVFILPVLIWTFENYPNSNLLLKSYIRSERKKKISALPENEVALIGIFWPFWNFLSPFSCWNNQVAKKLSRLRVNLTFNSISLSVFRFKINKKYFFLNFLFLLWEGIGASLIFKPVSL